MKWNLLKKSHHYNQNRNLNKLINDLELEKIIFQIRRAEVNKNKLLENIYREYESYLKVVRDLIFTSVEKTIYAFYSDFSINDNNINTKELRNSLENKISFLINSQLPLITIEQLKVNDSINNENQEKKFNVSRELFSLKDYDKVHMNFEEYLFSNESLQFNINKDISNSNEYYRLLNNEHFSSIDLDCSEDINYFPKLNSIKKLDSEDHNFSFFFEIIEDSRDNKFKDYQNLNNRYKELSPSNQNLNCFDLIDNSLANLLLNLSYKINVELFESKLIRKIISENTFKFLFNKKFIIKHPSPFIIEFDLNINQSFNDGLKLPSIYMLNISTVELEFNNLKLSIHRNKINELKNKFQLLIKKEKYWRQKEINLNKIFI